MKTKKQLYKTIKMNNNSHIININYFSILMLFFVCTNFSSVAQNAFSLKEAQDYAIKNNPNNQMAKLDVDFATAQKNEVRAIGLPQINGSIDLKDYINIPQSVLPNFIAPAIVGTLKELGQLPASVLVPDPADLPPIQAAFGTKYNLSANASLSQLIFSSDYLVGLQASKTFIDLSRKSLERSDIETKAAVAKAYYGVLVNRERIKIIDANITRVKKLKEDIQALTENGFAELIDKDRVEVTFNNLETEKEKFVRIIQLTEALLKFQMFFPIDQQITLKDSIDIKQLPAFDETDKSKLNVSNRVEYSILEKALKLNELSLKRYKGGYLPSLVGYASAGYSYLTPTLSFYGDQWIPIALVGATLNIPIFDGFSKHYKIQQGSINVQKSKMQIKQFEQAALLEFSSAQITYSNSLSSLKNQQRNVVLAENVYNTTKIKYEQGIGSNTDVINADASLKESQTNLFAALYDYYIAKVDMDKALGNIK